MRQIKNNENNLTMKTHAKLIKIIKLYRFFKIVDAFNVTINRIVWI